MKKIAIISANKIMAQGLSASLRERPELGMEPLPLLGCREAPVGLAALGADVAILDAAGGSACAEAEWLCRVLRENAPHCRLLLLVSQEDAAGQEMAAKVRASGLADDFVFYDSSLRYLFAKLAAF